MLFSRIKRLIHQIWESSIPFADVVVNVAYVFKTALKGLLLPAFEFGRIFVGQINLETDRIGLDTDWICGRHCGIRLHLKQSRGSSEIVTHAENIDIPVASPIKGILELLLSVRGVSMCSEFATISNASSVYCRTRY